MENNRSSWGSNLGFLLAAIGSAVGLGNIWGFPYKMGKCGGFTFLIVYLLLAIFVGMIIMVSELSIGRKTKKSPIDAYPQVSKKFSWIGWLATIAPFFIMSFYTVLGGYCLQYIALNMTKLSFGNAAVPLSGGESFGAMLTSPFGCVVFTILFIVICMLIVQGGVSGGIEKFNKVGMPALFVMLLIIIVRSLTLPNAVEGLKFYLLPNIEGFKEAGIGHVIEAAMNQSFFTLSIGIACIEIFGSYMSDEYTLPNEAVRICALDTFVAILSGLIIFPACFSFGVQPDQGPSLIFMTLPRVFMEMPSGRLWGTCFFLFMTFASFTTVITVFENLIATSMDNFHWSRKKAVMINCIFLLVASMPCVLGYNVLSNVHLIGARDILDSEDFIVSQLLLPIGALIYALFCTSNKGWGIDRYMNECNKGEGICFAPYTESYFRYILPILIIVVFVQGLL